MRKRRQLLTTADAVPAKKQHKSPCSDCPFSRKSLPGWLGGPTADDWLKEAHGDHTIPCHVFSGAQCAGAAIYRRNVLKQPRDPECLRLEANRDLVFATPMEFKRHHAREGGGGSAPATRTEGTQGTPRIELPVPGTGGTVMPKAEVVYANQKVAEVKAKHAKQLDGLKAAHEKKVLAAQAKGKRELDKAVATVVSIDTLLAYVQDAVENIGAGVADKVKKKLAGLIEKARKAAAKQIPA